MANLNMIMWKPIDGAPVDGTAIDLWCPNMGDPVDCRYPGVAWSERKKCWVDYLTDDPLEFLIQPTHWAAIPRGPEV